MTMAAIMRSRTIYRKNPSPGSELSWGSLAREELATLAIKRAMRNGETGHRHCSDAGVETISTRRPYRLPLSGVKLPEPRLAKELEIEHLLDAVSRLVERLAQRQGVDAMALPPLALPGPVLGVLAGPVVLSAQG